MASGLLGATLKALHLQHGQLIWTNNFKQFKKQFDPPRKITEGQRDISVCICGEYKSSCLFLLSGAQQGSNSVYKLITKIHFIQYLKHKLPLSPIKAFPARSSWATISPLVQLAKAGFLISIKTRGVKWEVLIKRVWSTSKEVAEVCGKKHSCQLLRNACEPRGVPGSERTLRLAGDCPHYPRQRVHPLTLRSNPPPASTPRVPYSRKLIYLGSFHWKTIKPLGFARDQSVIAPVVSVSKSIASLDAVAACSNKASLCWKESPQQLQIRDWAKYRKWCMQDSTLLSS